MGQHYDQAPQLYPDIQGDKLSSLECRTFRKFITLYRGHASVFDIGCGTGRVGRFLARELHPERLISMDISRLVSTNTPSSESR